MKSKEKDEENEVRQYVRDSCTLSQASRYKTKQLYLHENYSSRN